METVGFDTILDSFAGVDAGIIQQLDEIKKSGTSLNECKNSLFPFCCHFTGKSTQKRNGYLNKFR